MTPASPTPPTPPPPLTRKRFAFLATDGVEQATLDDPWRTLQAGGAEPELVCPGPGVVRTMRGMEFLGERTPDRRVAEISEPEEYAGLVLPGGLVSVDALRLDPAALAFIRAFFDAAKPVAASGHAPWLLVEAGVANGQRLTGAPSLRTDLRNAGATWSDEPVVVYRNLVTASGAAHVSAFSAAIRTHTATGVEAAETRLVQS